MTARREPDPPLDCDKCNDPHVNQFGRRTCSAHKTGGRGACGRYPVEGHHVCPAHGGNNALTRATGQRNLREAAVMEILRLNVKDIDTRHSTRSPDEQLLDEVARSAQMVEWLAEQVAKLDVPDLQDQGAFAGLVGVDPDTGEPIEQQNRNLLIGPDNVGNTSPHVYLTLLNQERDRHVKFCDTAIRAGISERLVRIAEQQGAQMVEVIRATVDAIPGLTPDQRLAAMKVAASRLRAIGSAPAQSPKVISH